METKSSSNGNTIFLTGTNGLLGNHIVRELLKKNYSVKALIEPGGSIQTLSGLNNIDYCYGNIMDGAFIERETKACNYIIHAAASTSVFPARNKLVNDINVTGTSNIINAAIKNKPKRLIHVGSANSFGYGSIHAPGDETKAFYGKQFGLDYIDSKYQAHQLVLNSVKEKNIPAIIVCPTFMLGAYDSKPGSGALVKSIYNKKLPGYSCGGKNYIHVNDVAVAIVNSLTMGRTGEAYILGHKNMNYKDAFRLIAQTVGVTPPALPLPKWLTLSYGAINEYGCKLLRKTPVVTLPIAKIGNEGFYYNSSKAINELALPQTPIEIAVKDCFNWLQENKLLN